MSIQPTYSSGTYFVEVNWPLNAHWAVKTVEIFKDVIDRGAERVIVNLANVSFIDSRGLLALLTGFKMFGNDTEKFRLVAPQAQTQLFFRVTRFDKVFRLTDQTL
jgi:anti-anti-sigma factor